MQKEGKGGDGKVNKKGKGTDTVKGTEYFAGYCKVCTMRPETNFERFGGFWNQLADSNSIFVAAEFFFERFEFLVC